MPKRNGASLEGLDELAKLLVARHLRNAVPDDEVRDRLALIESDHPYPKDLVERDMHCIAVVGSGASARLLNRGDDLARELEATFDRDEAELERLRLVNNLPEDAFETRLVALSKSPTAERRVRDEIAERYGVRHPTLLGYELLAHLLKHRFLDAIVSFNFDELLDQSLDDELDAREYKQVVSERDCLDLESNPSAPGYVPLYVKLHGTASEPESLRFTPHSYYAIPQRISRVVENLLRCEHCVIANIGFNLGSFDFQRLLRIPQKLDVFNLSYLYVPEQVQDKIDAERNALRRRGRSGQRASSDWLTEFGTDRVGGDVPIDATPEDYCNELLRDLTRKTERQAAATPFVQFRSVRRHETVSRLLGPDRVNGEWAKSPEWIKEEGIEYLERRTILELAFAAAKARGLLSLVPLTRDRPARYYDQLLQLTKSRGEDWTALCSAAGVQESDEVPDILVSHRSLRRQASNGSNGTHEHAELRETQRLNEFDAGLLARHVLARIKNPWTRLDLDDLEATIVELQVQSDIEFHMRDDRVCSKAFKQPETLATATSLEAYTRLMLDNLRPEDELHISAETGAWLLRPSMLAKLKQQRKIRLLLAFEIELDELTRHYGDRLMPRVIDPWRHNRHMTIVCNGRQPTQAIYFARRLRRPVVTAVYLRSIRDVQHLMTLYQQRWVEARPTSRRSP